ncbi:hypothetical protein ACOSQ4_013388 [Xanthoceras sorbifolium]
MLISLFFFLLAPIPDPTRVYVDIPEIEQGLSDAAHSKITVSFTPHLMPMIRGMQSTIYVDMAPGVTIEDLYEQLKISYKILLTLSIIYRENLPWVRRTADSDHSTADGGEMDRWKIFSDMSDQTKSMSTKYAHTKCMAALPLRSSPDHTAPARLYSRAQPQPPTAPTAHSPCAQPLRPCANYPQPPSANRTQPDLAHLRSPSPSFAQPPRTGNTREAQSYFLSLVRLCSSS